MVRPWIAAAAAVAATAASSFVAADGPADPVDPADPMIFEPVDIVAPFLEQFDAAWAARWQPSSARKAAPADAPAGADDILQYRGVWAVEPIALPGDSALVLKTAAAHHAISAKFPSPIDPKGKQLVLQYEVKLQNGLECGGAYLKLLSHSDSFEPVKFDDKTPYTIMFGPDHCGSTNKVHFIFRHKNPITGELEEKHHISPPQAITDKKTNLYTLIVRPDQSFEIRINNEKSASGSLLENFNPPVNPLAEINDPDDKKPADWVDTPKIADPKARKPDDWDESAPFEIVDNEAKQPEDWLTDEPLTIPDPEAKKPDDWDDDEDGEWTAPQISNPKCDTVSGCGEWKRPTKRNPAYKGKWTAPMIDNPAYKGPWEPRKIPNPKYFNDPTPSDFTPMGAIGFELWTMQDGIQFDNIYVGHSIADAERLATEIWSVKHKAELAEDPVPKKVSQNPTFLEKATDLFDTLKFQTMQFVQRIQQDPVAAAQELPHIAALLGTILLIPVLVLVLGSFAGSNKTKKQGPVDNEEEEGEGEGEDEGEGEGEKEDVDEAQAKDSADEVDADADAAAEEVDEKEKTMRKRKAAARKD